MANTDRIEFKHADTPILGWFDLQYDTKLEDVMMIINENVQKMQTTSPVTSIMINVHATQSWLPKTKYSLDQYDGLVEAILLSDVIHNYIYHTPIQLRYFFWDEWFVGNITNMSETDSYIYYTLYWYKIDAPLDSTINITIPQPAVSDI